MQASVMSPRRLQALALDWLLWTYLPAGVLYFYRGALAGSPARIWLYVATVPLGLAAALILQRAGTTIGERVAEIAPPQPVENGVVRRAAPWYRTQIGITGALLALVTFVLGWQITEIDLYSVFTRADRMNNIVQRLVRPFWPVAGVLLEKMVETIFLALMATAFSIPLAALVSFFAARNLMARLTAPWGRLLGSFVLGVLGAVLGISLVQLVMPGLVGSGLDVALITGILTPTMAIIGLVGFGYIGSRLLAVVLERGGPGLSRAVSALLGAILGIGAAYLLASLVTAVVYAGSWDIFVRDQSPWPYVVLAAGALVGIWYGRRWEPDSEFPIGNVLYDVVRFILNTTRSIEPFVWALVFVTWFRLGPFPGMVALLVHSVAALGKLYSESIESIDPGPLEAVRATGANEMQTVIFAVVPQIIPPYISFTIYRWDINVRMSTIIGLVGGGGIGQLLFQYQNLAQWRSVSVAVILIVAVVMTLDMVSARIRERII